MICAFVPNLPSSLADCIPDGQAAVVIDLLAIANRPTAASLPRAYSDEAGH